MKLLSTLLFAFGLGVFSARADLPANWSTNYDATLAGANTNQQPTLVYFTASWCGPCKLMTRITLTDSAVIQTLSNLEHVAVDIDEHPDLASKQGISAVPTFVLLSFTGDEVDRATGFQPVGDFLQWLTNGIFEAHAAALQQAHAKKELAAVDLLFASMATNSTRLAAEKLFDLCAGRNDAVIQAAAARLKILAMRDPAAVLDGLDDPRLAARIQAANTLRGIIGDAFDVDPWSDVGVRGKAINLWRKKLAQASPAENSHDIANPGNL